MAKQDPTQLIIYAGLGYAFYHYGKAGKLGKGISDFLNNVPTGGGGGGGGGGTTPPAKPPAGGKDPCAPIEGVQYVAMRDGAYDVVVAGVLRYRFYTLELAQGVYNYLVCGGPKPAGWNQIG